MFRSCHAFDILCAFQYIYIYIFALPVMVLNDLYIHAIYVTFCYILLDIPYIHILRVYTLTYTHRHMPHLFTLYIYAIQFQFSRLLIECSIVEPEH